MQQLYSLDALHEYRLQSEAKTGVTRMASHAERNLHSNAKHGTSGILTGYEFSRILSKAVFIPDYPELPRTFGEQLRKSRLDQGRQIKDVASVIGVTEDSIINWERRGIRPRKVLLTRLLAFYGM